MDTKNIVLTSIWLILLTIIITGCPGPCIEANYTFKVSAHFSPESDSLYVGDTLFLTISFPTKMIDLNSGNEVNYTNAKGLGSNLFISRLVPGGTVPTGAVTDFIYLASKGQIYTDNSSSVDGVKQLSYTESNGRYELKVAMIAQKIGIYDLGVGNGLSIGRNGNNNCEKASLQLSVDNVNQHLYYLEEFLQRPIPEINQKNSYCFKVIAR